MKVKLFLTNKKMYLVNEESINFNDLCLFVIGEKAKKYVVGCPDDLLGDQIKEVYKLIIDTKPTGLKYVKNELVSVTPGDLKKITKNGGECEIEAVEICPHYGGTHIGKDCSCKSGFVLAPKLNNNKVIFVI